MKRRTRTFLIGLLIAALGLWLVVAFVEEFRFW
jgi:hypothetical protein